MPKKNKRLLLEKNSYQQFIEELEWQETNGMTQLKINTAIEQLNLLNIEGIEKDNLSHLQLKLLKGYFKNYLKKINDEKASGVAVESILINAQAEKDLKTMLNRAYACYSNKTAITNQVSNSQQISLSSDQSNELFLNKYAALINFKISIKGLDDKKTAIPTAKRLFLLFNQILTFYPVEIRGCFDLASLLVSCEKPSDFFRKFKRFFD